MALAFGGGVRPELGRTDYSAIARGSEIAAQLSAQGSQMVGQGLAKALEGAGKAIANYQERKETNKIFDGTVDDLIKADTDSGGALAKQLKIGDPTDRKAWSVGLQSLGPDKRTSALMGRQLLQQLSGQQQMAEAFSTEVTRNPSVVENQIMGGRRFEDLSSKSSDFAPTVTSRSRTPEETIQLLLASGMAPGAAANIFGSLVSAEQTRTPEEPKDKRTTKQNDYEYAINTLGLSPEKANEWVRNGGTTTTINTGTTGRLMENAFNSLSTQLNNEINPILATAPSLEAMEILINNLDGEGNIITGGLAKLELGAKSKLNATGLTDFTDVARTQEYIGNSVNLVGQVIKQFGAGTGLSDADREFAEKAAAGDIRMDRAALQRLVSIAKKVSEFKINLYNERVRRTFSGDDQESKFALNSLLVSRQKKGFAENENLSVSENILKEFGL